MGLWVRLLSSPLLSSGICCPEAQSSRLPPSPPDTCWGKLFQPRCIVLNARGLLLPVVSACQTPGLWLGPPLCFSRLLIANSQGAPQQSASGNLEAYLDLEITQLTWGHLVGSWGQEGQLGVGASAGPRFCFECESADTKRGKRKNKCLKGSVFEINQDLQNKGA